MMNLVKKLLLVIAGGIFSAIEDVYRLFYGLATTKLFSNDAVQTVSNRLYILVSIVILFAFAVKLIEAIVNPDLLTDSKKGVTGVLKRTIIGLILIVAIPNIFNFLYFFQYEVLSTSLVEKIILGYTDTNTNPSDSGGVLTSSIIRGFVYPIDENGSPITEYSLCGDDANCNYPQKLVDKASIYNEYISLIGGSPNYDDLSDLSLSKEWEETEEPYYHVSGLLLVAAGIYVLYQVITMCFDAALRLVNLGILEIIAPIIIIAYMAGGTDYLSKWAKMVVEKFLSIFIRIAALAFMILGLDLMTKSEIFNSQSTTFMFKLLVIIGLLRLVKDLPNIISKIFGVDVKTGGGIKGRLGEMAGIGGLAQKAWAGMGGLAKTAGYAGLALGKTGIQKADKLTSKLTKGHSIGDGINKLGETKVGRGLKKAGSYAVRGGKVVAAGYNSGGKGTGKALKDAIDKNFALEKKDRQAKIDKEKSDRVNARIKNATGRGSFSGEVEFDGNKINFQKTGAKLVAKGKAAKDLNDEIIDGLNLGAKSSEVLKNYNKKMDALKNAQYEKHNQDALLAQLEEMKSHANENNRSSIDNIIQGVKNGTFDNNQALLSQALTDANLDFSNKEITSDLLGSLMSNTTSEKAKNDLFQAKALFDSGDLKANELQDYIKAMVNDGELDSGVASDFISAIQSTSKNSAQMYIDKVNNLASTSGALTASDTINYNLQNAQTDASKAQKKADERKDLLTGDEKYAYSEAYSTVEKTIDADYTQRMVNDSRTSYSNPVSGQTGQNQNQNGQQNNQNGNQNP